MKIVEILMNRDGMTLEDASDLVNDVRHDIHEVLECGGGYEEVEDIMYSELGLEMDYVDELLELL